MIVLIIFGIFAHIGISFLPTCSHSGRYTKKVFATTWTECVYVVGENCTVQTLYIELTVLVRQTLMVFWIWLVYKCRCRYCVQQQ